MSSQTLLKPTLGILASLCLVWSGGCAATTQADTLAPSTPVQDLAQGQQLPLTATTEIHDQSFLLEVAATLQQQRVGLMFRESLDPDRGMIFPYDPPAPRIGFWMYNTRIPLDIIFIADEQVVHIAANVPPCTTPPTQCPTYGPDPGHPPIDVVLELAGGRAAELELEVGDPVSIRPLDTPLPHDYRDPVEGVSELKRSKN